MNVFSFSKIRIICLCLVAYVRVTAASDDADLSTALDALTASFQTFQKALVPAQDDGDNDEEPIDDGGDQGDDEEQPIEDHAFDDIYAALTHGQPAYEHDSEAIIQALGAAASGADYLAILQRYDTAAPGMQNTLAFVTENAGVAAALTLSSAQRAALKDILQAYNTVTQHNMDALTTAQAKLNELEQSAKSKLNIAKIGYPYADDAKLRDPWIALGISSKGATPEAIQAAWKAKDDLLIPDDYKQKQKLITIRDYLIDTLLPATQHKEAAEKNLNDAKALSIYSAPLFEESFAALQAVIGIVSE